MLYYYYYYSYSILLFFFVFNLSEFTAFFFYFYYSLKFVANLFDIDHPNILPPSRKGDEGFMYLGTSL